MSGQKGYTLVEIITVLIILSILVAIALPNYNTYMQQGAGHAAQNNLISIYNAQQNYYFTNAAYCRSTGPPPHQCGSLTGTATSINPVLSLNITDNNFTYNCIQGGAGANGFQCTATNNLDRNFILTLTNNAIVLPGNPSCVDAANPAYCNF